MTYTEYLKVKNNLCEDELMHYGVLGMKWGIRRYQNYDGSYTKKGLARYSKAKTKRESAFESYEKQKKELKNAKKSSNEDEKSDAIRNLKAAKREYKTAKREEKNEFKKLKTDKMADQGKELYKRGKTITDNRSNLFKVAAGTTIASIIAQSIANNSEQKYIPLGKLGVASTSDLTRYISNGAAILTQLGYGAKVASENKKLRAFYAH